MRRRDWMWMGAGLLGIAALVTWWLREGFEEVPAPGPVVLDAADPAQHFGAAAAADEELADRLLAETHGDAVVAEDRFEERRAGTRT